MIDPLINKDRALNGVSAAIALGQARARLAVTPQAPTAGRDADLLLRHIKGLSQASLLAYPEQLLTMAELEAFYQAIERRAASEPMQYITGVQEFYGLVFAVTPAVLIPRPETEHLVEAALEIARGLHRPASILDVGTGSGAIAVTLAHLLPDASVTATDISPRALATAKQNAEAHGVAARVSFLETDLLPHDDAEAFDLICSNPPYVPNNEILEIQVNAYEPHSALFAGPDGLDIYRRLIPLAHTALKPEGWLLLEIGHGQQSQIEALLQAARLRQIRFLPDLQGIARVAVAQKQSA